MPQQNVTTGRYMSDGTEKAKPITDFTEKQQLYINGVVNGLTPKKAAIEAGYKNPDTQIRLFASHLEVVQAISDGVKSKAVGYAGRAFETLVDLMEDTHTRDSVRRQCAIDILNRAGVTEQEKVKNGELGPKNPSDMSVSELEAFIKSGTSELNKISSIEGEKVDKP